MFDLQRSFFSHWDFGSSFFMTVLDYFFVFCVFESRILKLSGVLL